jgi:hypothetical protein
VNAPRTWTRSPQRAAGMAFDISANSRQWAEALDLMDRGGRLPLQEQNRLLDQIIVSQDAERAAAVRALQARVEREKRR